MLPALAQALAAELEALDDAGRLRSCPPVSGVSRVRVDVGERPLTSFCSNDYLGLSTHPTLIQAAAAALPLAGTGAAASRLVSGDQPEHRALETTLARYLHTEAALVFPTGYQANLGVLTALAGRDDLIVSDAANHASLIDGCRLSRARVLVYPHLDVAAAAAALASAPARRKFLLTESLFSMDGDTAPLAALAQLAARAGAVLVVDEAHAIGVLGPAGRGLCAAAGVRPDVLIGTLGKAFGAAGGFVAGDQLLRAILVNRARTFIYTTGLPPPVAAAARAGVDLSAGPEGDRRRARLLDNTRVLRAALGRPTEPSTPIVPYLLGPDALAVEASRQLLARGFFVQAIRPPTVPDGTARLRITLSADHQPHDVEALATALHSLQVPRP